MFSIAWQSLLKSWVCPWPLERSKAVTECTWCSRAQNEPWISLASQYSVNCPGRQETSYYSNRRGLLLVFLFESLNSFKLILICFFLKHSAFTALKAASVPDTFSSNPDTLSSNADTQTAVSSARYPHPFSSMPAVLCGAGPQDSWFTAPWAALWLMNRYR